MFIDQQAQGTALRQECYFALGDNISLLRGERPTSHHVYKHTTPDGVGPTSNDTRNKPLPLPNS